jgi:hypothetical protein
VEKMVLGMLNDARRIGIPVNRSQLQAFGQGAKEQLMANTDTDEEERKALATFEASDGWAKKFVERNSLSSKLLHGEAGSVDAAAIAEGLASLRELMAGYDPDHIYNVDETGLFYRLLPRRTYTSLLESKKSVRGTKGMKAKDRLSIYICTNATGTQKVKTARA